MVSAGGLTFREYIVQDPLPLSRLHEAMLDFLRGRDDAVVFGAPAVNAHVAGPRMTQDADIMSAAAEDLAESLRRYLAEVFHSAVRVRTVAGGRGLRVYQVQKAGNRHLAGIRAVDHLPPVNRLNGIPVLDIMGLIARKVVSLNARRGSPEAGTDWRALALLLLNYPGLKRDPGPVTDRLISLGAYPAGLSAWRDLVGQEFRAEGDEDEFD